MTEIGYCCNVSRTAGPVNLGIPWTNTVLPCNVTMRAMRATDHGATLSPETRDQRVLTRLTWPSPGQRCSTWCHHQSDPTNTCQAH